MLDELIRDSVQGCLMDVSHKFFLKNFERVSKLEVHPGQIPIIRLLGSIEGLSQKEIAGKLNIKPPTVNVSVQRMEKAGLAYRRADKKDQRITRIYLTDKGKEINERIADMMEENESIITANFTESELCLLKRMLRQVSKNLEDASR